VKESIRAGKPTAPPRRAAGVAPSRGLTPKAVGPVKPAPSTSGSNKWKWGLAGGALLLVVAIVAVAWPRGPRPEVTEVKEREKKLFEEGKNLSPEEFKKERDALREAREKLTKQEKDQLGQERFKEMQKRMKETVASYAKMPREEKIKFLDQQIDEMENRRKQFQALFAAGGPGGQGAPGGQAGAGAPAAGNQPGGQAGNQPGQAGTNQPGTGTTAQAGPGGGWNQMTTEERQNRRKAMLDSTTPEQRAQFDQYFRDMAARRQARGMSGGWGGFGGR
jgi:hypothetical protein